MISRTIGRWRAWSRMALAGCLLAGLPSVARSDPRVVADRGTPSSLAATYGPAVDLSSALAGAPIAAFPTGSGVELLLARSDSVGTRSTFRTAGTIRSVAAHGTTLFLFAGPRGVIAVDAADAAAPVAVHSYDRLGNVATGAALDAWPGVVAASGDSTLDFLAYDPASGFSLARSVTYTDGRLIRALAVRSDSVLVASVRPGPVPRLTLTLYRYAGPAAAPESLSEFAFNGHVATDVAWTGPLAFLADGNLGVSVIDVAAKTFVRSVPVQGAKLVRSLALSGDTLAVAAEGRTVATFLRIGSGGDDLAPVQTTLTTLEPVAIRAIASGFAVSTVDFAGVTEPDEVGASQVELVGGGGPLPVAPYGAAGRTRRVAIAGGLAVVADYTGGLRIYRAAGADTSLVGVLPETGTGRAVDVALDPARGLAFVAGGTSGLEVVRVSDPAAPAILGSFVTPGLASAVAVVGPSLVAVGYRGVGSAGVTFVDVADSTNPVARGSVGFPSLQDVRALAARDTVLYVADETLGLVSIGFGNPDLPGILGIPSGEGARALDLTGTTLLVGTRAYGLQLVDAFAPASLILRATLPTPPILGIARGGASAALFLGTEGALVVDATDINRPVVRGPIGVPGVARGGAWSGDTLVVASGLSLERYLVSPTPQAVPALTVTLDAASVTPRAVITWAPVVAPGIVGLNLYRDLGPATGGDTEPAGRLVNRALLDPAAVSATDDSLTAGAVHRYRLEAYRADGSAIKVAEGSLTVPAVSAVGRPYPNPFRARGAATAVIPFRTRTPAPGPTITLRIFDLHGRLVRSMDVPAPPGGGFGSVAWDGRDRDGRRVPNGTYYLRLTGSGIDDAKTITLLR